MKLFCEGCNKDIRNHTNLTPEGCPYCKSSKIVVKDRTDRAWVRWWYSIKKTLDKSKKVG